MNLESRKQLAAKTFGVGKRKILFDVLRLEEIKEAITRQDIRDLHESGAIMIRANAGRKTKPQRTTRRGPGKRKMMPFDRKKKYMTLTRKFRRYLGELRNQEKITEAQYWDFRKKVRASTFKDKAHLKQHISGELK